MMSCGSDPSGGRR